MISKIKCSQNTSKENISCTKRDAEEILNDHFALCLPHSNAKVSKSVKSRVNKPMVMNRD